MTPHEHNENPPSYFPLTFETKQAFLYKIVEQVLEQSITDSLALSIQKCRNNIENIYFFRTNLWYTSKLTENLHAHMLLRLDFPHGKMFCVMIS